MFLGNDYVWPRISHRLAARYIGETGGQVLDDRYLPFGVETFPAARRIRRLKPNAMLLSLIGQDAVEVQSRIRPLRAVARHGPAVVAIEENGLLAIGAHNTEGLFVSSGYFGSLDNDANMAFKERYHNHFGERAPTLNALGQSTYEGMHFLAALARRAADENAQLLGPLSTPLAYRSVRGTRTPTTIAALSRRTWPRPGATSSKRRSRCSGAGRRSTGLNAHRLELLENSNRRRGRTAL